MKGGITVVGGNDNTKVALEICAPFTKCITDINDEQVDHADNIDIVMHIYNLTEYSDNYSVVTISLWQFKKDEQSIKNGVPVNVDTTNSTSFKYKSSFINELATVGANKVLKNKKVAVSLKYLSNFWRSWEMLLINCKIHLELNWSKNCIMFNVVRVTEFEITNTKLYVPIFTLSSKDKVKLVKILEEGFKRPVYWNEYQTKIESKNLDNSNFKRFALDASFQWVRRLFVLAFNNTTDNDNNPINDTVFSNIHRKSFPPIVNITNYNVLIDWRNFYDQPINDLVKSMTKL